MNCERWDCDDQSPTIPSSLRVSQSPWTRCCNLQPPISYHQRPLPLTRYEYLLLKTLLLAPGRVFSRQQLMESVWAQAEESLDRTVDTHIKTLRAKLRAVEPGEPPIHTHRGLGYSVSRQP